MACPKCGKELTYIPKYDRFYCYSCGNYAPRGYGASLSAGPPIQIGPVAAESHEGHYHCPSCGKELTYLAQYLRYFCYAEGRYAPKDVQPVTPAPALAPPEQRAPIGGDEPVPEVETSTEVHATAGAEIDASAVEVQRTAAEPEPDQPGPVAREPSAAETRAAQPETTAESPPSEPPAVAPTSAVSVESSRPSLRRNRIIRAKKSELAAWCRAYGLDEVGTRIALRDRLLAYLAEPRIRDLAEPRTGEVKMEAVEATPAEAVPPEATPGGTPPEPAPAPPQPVWEPVSSAPVSTEPRIEIVPQEEPTNAVEAETPVEPSPTETAAVEPAVTRVPESAVAETTEAGPAEESSHARAVAVVAEPVAQSEKAAPPEVTPIELATPLPCPTCGKGLTYVAQYDRLYCYTCGTYAPKAYGGAGVPAVEVPPPATQPVTPQPRREPRVENPCPSCGKELAYIKEYDRWYCYGEKKYPPKKVRNPCPTCGKDLTFIGEYNRWYCYAEGAYAPNTYVGAVATRVARPVVRSPAPASRPQAERAAMPLATSAEKAAGAIRAAHAHGRPGVSIGLAATGFTFLLIPKLLDLLALLAVFDPVVLGPLPALFLPALELLGVLLAMAGVAGGLWSLGSR